MCFRSVLFLQLSDKRRISSNYRINRQTKGKRRFGESGVLRRGVSIGSKTCNIKKIKDEYMQRLLANMLYLDPEKRISAQEVLDVLKNKRVLAFDPNQGIVINGTTSTFSTRPSTPTERSDTDTPRSYCEPWDEHKCKFDIAELKASGFVSSKKINRKGVNCYQFYRADGTHNIFSINTLRILGWVTDISSADEKMDEKHLIHLFLPMMFGTRMQVTVYIMKRQKTMVMQELQNIEKR